ncbi:TPA: hypothetical protein ACK0EI_002683 [Staphylococcus aureus]|uniref:hypothetical protein n=1 Tax=Staphylococcus aureus TaxID=1280 RepID=UPI0006BA8F52|nr:hypothetical protein [Staphylococcus aureus]SCT29136.1 Uncharacterised protein [Staphylococcus aureus]SCT70818.1 Uncharacterised protein [Staphylococcus aureus]SUK64507.1 Uncharacterised protein [Staphylococcus aureus]HDG3988829.1 hypothetical protein [Staphylococcus aureus]HDG3989027.1 hypothetical protein [Staphylococcus aureus]
MERICAIEYFIKKNENDNKITKVKMYETHREGGTYTFTSKPFYEDRESLIKRIRNHDVFVIATRINEKNYIISDSFTLTTNNYGYINTTTDSTKDYLTFIPIKIKNNE